MNLFKLYSLLFFSLSSKIKVISWIHMNSLKKKINDWKSGDLNNNLNLFHLPVILDKSFHLTKSSFLHQ